MKSCSFASEINITISITECLMILDAQFNAYLPAHMYDETVSLTTAKLTGKRA